MKFLIVTLLLSFNLHLFSQQTQKYKDEINYSYNTAKDLYERGMYVSAQKIFVQILMSEGEDYSFYRDEAAYYIAMCSMNLFNWDAEYQLNNFIETHPESYNNNSASFQMANYHFRNKKYKNAIEWYEKTSRVDLTNEEQSEYFFKLGFSHFARKDFDQAAKVFYEAKDKNDVFGIMSLYFYSHIKYINQQYQTALNGFLILEKNPMFSAIAPFYIAQIYFLQEKYEDVIRYTPSLMDTIKGAQLAEISKLVGSSYYRLGKYEESIPYLQKYISLTSNISDFDYYELGFAYYSTNKYEVAANTFSKIKKMKDTLSQNAVYHMADCYLKLDKKVDARRSFETASLYNFNPEIREDALFNFAQLSFELSLSPFSEAIKAFNQYIHEYPNSPRIDMAYDYLVDAFLSTKNYQEAINIIEKMNNRNPKIDAVYQRLTYFRGLEYFTELRYDRAIPMFDKSLKYGIYDKNINSLAHYWKAEANYRLNKIDEAIGQFKEFVNSTGSLLLDEYGIAHYNLGYAYFNKKDYVTANSWFRKFEMHEKGKNTTTLNDALNRIGDCYFITKEYKPAADYYKKGITMGLIGNDYSLYQMALSYGGLKMSDQKIWSLKRLIREYPASEYVGNANFEIGRTYHTAINELDSAKYYYNNMITKYPKSSMRKAALSGLGAIYFSQKDYNKSIEIYKQVVTEYPNTEESANAAEMLKAIYIEQGNQINIDDLFEGTTGITLSQEEQDDVMWAAAKKLYNDQKYNDALISLTNYLDKFPKGTHYIEANYFKAELSFYFEEKEDALVSYKIVADAPRGNYTEESTLKVASLLYDEKRWNEAYNYYERLYPVSENKSTKLIAAIGRLRCAYILENYDNVISAAVDIIESEKSNEEQVREAYYKMAKAYSEQGNNIRALGLFESLSKEVISYEGAESKYRVAEINYMMDRDSIAEELIYEFAQSNSPHAYWLAKGFILLSDIYRDNGDNFSAKQALQTVLTNYSSETDGIKEEASLKMNEIIDEEESSKVENEYLDLKINLNLSGEKNDDSGDEYEDMGVPKPQPIEEEVIEEESLEEEQIEEDE